MFLTKYIFIILFVSCSITPKGEENASLNLTDLLQSTVDDEIIAKKLVQYKYLKEDNSDDGYNYSKDTKIAIGFPQRVVPFIHKSKIFLNRYQLPNTNLATPYIIQRMRLEDNMIFYNLSNNNLNEFRERIYNIRPKYAFLIPKNIYNYPNSYINQEYGNIYAVLNDSVKSRSTFTIGDSSEFNVGEGAKTFFYKAKAKSYYTTAKNYWEAQVWGPITTSHIDYFLVNCPNSPKIRRENLELLFDLKRPIFFCNINPDGTNLTKTVRVTIENINDFPKVQDEISPTIRNLSIYVDVDSNSINIAFDCMDNDQVSLCQASVIRNKEIIDQKDLVVKDVKLAKFNHSFKIRKSPFLIKILVKDFIGNIFVTTKDYRIGEK